MKIRMLKLAAGPDGIFPAGAVVDVDEKTAKSFVDSGAAVYLGKEKEVETAAVQQEEKAIIKKGKKKRVR